MKAYTDLNQSKTLAKILSSETADMCYNDGELRIGYASLVIERDDYFPCWSLASLLDILESEIDGENGETYQLNIEKVDTWWNLWYKEIYNEANPIEIDLTEELIDACVEMIIKLKEKDLI